MSSAEELASPEGMDRTILGLDIFGACAEMLDGEYKFFTEVTAAFY